jgi:hypothetical protein
VKLLCVPIDYDSRGRTIFVALKIKFVCVNNREQNVY